MIRIPMTKNYTKNLSAKYRTSDDGRDGVPCVCCGKPVPDPPRYSIIEGNGSGWAVMDEEEARDVKASRGEQPVGADCWKKFPELHPYRFIPPKPVERPAKKKILKKKAAKKTAPATKRK